MYKINVELTTISPLAMHRLTEDDIEKIRKGSTGGKKKPDDAQKEALDRCYWDKDEIVIPKRNIKKCLLEGIRKSGLKYGRGSLEPYVKATVFIDGELIPIGKKKPDSFEQFPVQRKDGGQVIVTRALFNTGLKIGFTLSVFDDRRDADQLRVAMDEAGLLCGLCAGRPEYGRFEVTKWKVVK